MERIKDNRMKFLKFRRELFYLIILSLISISAILLFSCQKSEEPAKKQKKLQESKYQEYVLESLEVGDQLQELAEKIRTLLGFPHGEGLDTNYSKYRIEAHRFELGTLGVDKMVTFGQKFIDKYADRYEKNFWSYWSIHNAIIAIHDFDKWKSEENWYILGFVLGNFIYRCDQLKQFQDEFWLLTSEDLAKMKQKLQEDIEKYRKERGRLLEERFRTK